MLAPISPADRLPTDALQECPHVQRDDYRKFDEATSIRNYRNPKHSRVARVEAPVRDSPSRRIPTWEGAHPNPDDCRKRRGRLVRRCGVVAAPSNNGNRRIRRAGTALRDSFPVLDKTRRPSAAARKTVSAGPIRARQPQQGRAAHPATRHPD